MQRGQDNEIWNEDGTGSGRRGMGIQGGPEFNSSDPMSNQPQQGFRGENQARFGNDDNAAFSSGGGPGQFGNNVDPAMQGSMQKAAGRVSGNTNLVERGEMRKTGGPQADDTLL
ncbi:hypothetical protein FKP32DRAFT_1604000 [Trametes sanguinea]|nr:hypothetical protein FKP32DRAFT_1604000 [Trametes sanguinea]